MAETFNLGDAVLRTDVDLTGLNAGLEDAQDTVEEKSNDIGRVAAKGIATGVAGLAAILGGTVVAGLVDVSERAAQARTALQDMADVDYESLLRDAALLESRFGADFESTLGATRTLMSQFGMTSDEALSFITAGFERGLDTSGDFLDTIGEYSNLFAEGGATADEFFSLMETGLQGGALGTDKAADAFKEFGIRIREMGDDVFGPDGILRWELKMTDEEVSDFADGMRDGTISVADAYRELMPRIRAINDPIARNAAGVKLFGTQWEDLGATAITNIDLTATSMTDIDEAADKSRNELQSLGDIFPVLWSEFTSALLPAHDSLLAFTNDVVMPAIGRFREFMQAINDSSSPFRIFVSNLINSVQPAIEALVSVFMATWEAMQPVVEFVEQNLRPVLVGLSATILTVIAVGFVPLIATFWATATAAAAAALATAVALAPIIAIAAAIGVAAGLLYAAWEENLFGIRDVTSNVLTAISQFFNETVPKIVETVVNGWNTMATSVTNAVTTLRTNVETTIATLRTNVETTWNSLRTTVETTVRNLRTNVEDTITTLRTNVETTWNNLRATIETTVRNLRTNVEDTITTLRTNVENTWTRLRTNVETTITGLQTSIANIWNGIKTTIETIVGLNSTSGLWGSISTAWTNISNSITDSVTTAKDNVLNQFGAMRDALSAGGTLATQIFDNAKAIGVGVVNGVQQAWQALTGTDSLAGRFFSFVNNSLDQVRTDIANNGLGNTLANLARNLVDKIDSALTGLSSGDSLFSKLFDLFNDTFHSLRTITGSLLQNIQSFAQNMISEIINTFTATNTGFYQNVWNSIVNAWSTLRDNVGAGALLDHLQQFARNMINRIIENTNGFYHGMWRVIVDAWKALILETFSGEMLSSLTRFATNMINRIMENMGGFFHGMWKVIVDGWNALVGETSIGAMGQAIWNFATAMINRIKSSFSWNSIGQWLIDLFTQWARTWFSGGQPRGTSMQGMGMVDAAAPSSMMMSSASATTTYNVTAQYGYQPERSLRDDIRLLQLIQSTV